jgi:hypothetical protein
MMGGQEKQQAKPKEQKVKSLEFFKPTLATTLAIVLAWLLSVRPAQAGYTKDSTFERRAACLAWLLTQNSLL